jgi:hypothetical protein
VQNPGPKSGVDAATSSGTDCIFEGTIRDYRVLDESNLVVSATPKKKYHIELNQPAFGLSSAWNIGFTSTTSRICPGFSRVVFDSDFAPGPVRIRSIRAIDDIEFENLLVHFGKKLPEKIKTPPAEPVDGAKVEELD